MLERAGITCSLVVAVFFSPFAQIACYPEIIQSISVSGHKQDFSARKQILPKIYGLQLGLLWRTPNRAGCACDKGCAVRSGASQALV